MNREELLAAVKRAVLTVDPEAEVILESDDWRAKVSLLVARARESFHLVPTVLRGNRSRYPMYQTPRMAL